MRYSCRGCCQPGVVLDPIVDGRSPRFVRLSHQLGLVNDESSELGEGASHRVPVPPTLTNAHPGENPPSRGSSRDAHAATASSLVRNGFFENG